MKWTPAIITAILASYGWWLVVEHAKFREASDLYASVISLLNGIASQGKEAWEKNSNKLDQHTELKFLLHLEAVEQRLGILKSHYRNLGKSISDLRSQITRLRHFLTATPLAFGTEKGRSNAIIRLTHTMTSQLLYENYCHISKGRKRSLRVGLFVLVLCVLVAFFTDFIFARFELPTSPQETLQKKITVSR